MTAKPKNTATKKALARRFKSSKKETEKEELKDLRSKMEGGTLEEVDEFTSLSISSRTKKGLTDAHFVKLTDIQKCTLPLSLNHYDLEVTARTGSGKTLAFLIPIIESLYLRSWGPMDGLGALILSPTRELALQTFQVLQKIGKYHQLSAGLVIGGKDLREEREVLERINILVCTPGRLLQHMDQTVKFEWNQLQILVLDEADRIMDLGFENTVKAILSALPPPSPSSIDPSTSLPSGRQTLLFSATPTPNISASLNLPSPPLKIDLRLSFDGNDNADSIGNGNEITQKNNNNKKLQLPKNLTHSWIECLLEDKVDRLFSFIKSHLGKKIVVFMSSCKQVRFIYESFCTLQPGMPLLHLHGRQKQQKRMDIFFDFAKRKSGVLFATDIAARGLDFPLIDYVVQLDCPEDVDTYLHRIGRTARMESKGEAIIYLLKEEKDVFLSNVSQRLNGSIVALKSQGGPKRRIKSQLDNLCSSKPEIAYLAKKALISYVKCLAMQKVKLSKQSLALFASSLGLPGTPRLRICSRQKKNVDRTLAGGSDGEDDGDGDIGNDNDNGDICNNNNTNTNNTNPVVKTKIDKMFQKKNLSVLSDHYARLNDNASYANLDNDNSDNDSFLSIKRKNHDIEDDSEELPSTIQSKKAIMKANKMKSAASIVAAKRTHLVFDAENGRDGADDNEEDDVLGVKPRLKLPYKQDATITVEEGEEYIAAEKERLSVRDKQDYLRVKEKKREQKFIEKEKRRRSEAAKKCGSDDDGDGEVILGSASE